MPAISRSQGKTDIANFLADNTNREISEQDVRDRLIDTVDSYFNVLEGLGFTLYEPSTTYNPDDPVIFNRQVFKKIGVAESGVEPSGPAIGTSWQLVGTGIFASSTGYGLSKTATQAEVDAGTDQFTYVTPATLNTLLNSELSDITALRTLTGTNTGDTDLGTVNQNIVADNSNIKTAINSISDNIAIPSTRIPVGDGSNGLTSDAGFRYDNGNILLGTALAANLGGATNTLTMTNGSLPGVTDVDSYSLYSANFRGSDGLASPFAITEDGLVINFRTAAQVTYVFTNETNIDTADIHTVVGDGFFEADYYTSPSIDISTLSWEVAPVPTVEGDPIVWTEVSTVDGVTDSVNAFINGLGLGDPYSDTAFYIRPLYEFRPGDANKKGVINLKYNYR